VCLRELAALVERALFDHLICPPEHRWRNREPEGLGGLQVDHQLELRGLLDWEIGWLRSPRATSLMTPV